jgi:glucuronate isomerase
VTLLSLHPDRFFDPQPDIRRAARALLEEVSGLPLICPHGHVPPEWLATNAPFADPTELLVTPDHYILRMLYSRGIPMKALGVTPADGSDAPASPRRVWQTFADHYHLFLGTPTRAWFDYGLHEVFGIRYRLDGTSADRIYDEIAVEATRPRIPPDIQLLHGLELPS